MGVKNVYRKGGDDVLSSADFYDLATNIAYKTFYIADLQTGNDVLSYILTTQTPFSTTGLTSVENTALERNFDITFTSPLTVEGDAIFTIPTIMSGASPMTGVWTFQLYRVRGGTEAAMGSKITWTLTAAGDNYVFSGRVTIPKTDIRKDDIIRAEITVTSDTAGEVVRFMYDPQNRTNIGGVAVTRSQASINLPIKIPK